MVARTPLGYPLSFCYMELGSVVGGSYLGGFSTIRTLIFSDNVSYSAISTKSLDCSLASSNRVVVGGQFSEPDFKDAEF